MKLFRIATILCESWYILKRTAQHRSFPGFSREPKQMSHLNFYLFALLCNDVVKFAIAALDCFIILFFGAEYTIYQAFFFM